jgi:hypothetical protein
MDLVAMEGGSMASVPARLLHGEGRGREAHVALRQPRIHNLDNCAVVVLLLRGWHWRMKQLPARPDVPLATPTGGGTG